ncbi:hypothetical protein [Streptomyces sp. NPDC051183]|uniref:hypothetical protein n=1 Tax=Streptomyces sp. NPDC051183 TaxID=3155165 RepID=UPI003429CC12
MESVPPGEIGYELTLPAHEVHRTLRDAGELLGAAPPDALDARLGALRAELAAALEPVLDLEAGLARLSGAIGSRLPVPPYGAPEPAAPRPGEVGAPGSGLRAYAAGLAARGIPYRMVERARFPVAELAAVRLGALFAFHTDRFRRDAERSGFPNSACDFTAVDARAFARALARDLAGAAPLFGAVTRSDAVRRAHHLASSLERDDPHTNEIAHDGIDLALALGEFRRRSLDLALQALSPRRGEGSALAEALSRCAFDAERVIVQLRTLSSDLSAAESTLPDGVYVDMARDFAAHEAYHLDLIHGIDAARDALSEGAAARSGP